MPRKAVGAASTDAGTVAATTTASTSTSSARPPKPTVTDGSDDEAIPASGRLANGDLPEFHIDPATGRKVKAKKANLPFLAWQSEKKAREARLAEEERTGKRPEGAPGLPRFITFLFKWSFVAALASLAAGQFVAGDFFWGYRAPWMNVNSWSQPKERVFTPAELRLYNGRDPKKPIYVSILGRVYDVTEGRRIYGPGGPYQFFSGRDASRAYVTGCFDSHLTHDLRGLDVGELQQVQMWQTFFDNHAKYFYVGKLDLKPIDPATAPPGPCSDSEKK